MDLLAWLGNRWRTAEKTDFGRAYGSHNAKRRCAGNNRKSDSGHVEGSSRSAAMNGNTDNTMCSIAGELGVRMRVRRFKSAETKNQQHADEGQPASEESRVGLVNC